MNRYLMIKNRNFRNILKILKCFFIFKKLKKNTQKCFLTLKNAFENMPFFVLKTFKSGFMPKKAIKIY